jgi:hypothetical protein
MLELISAMSPDERIQKTGRLFASGKYLAALAVKKLQPDIEGMRLEIEIFKWIHQSKMGERELAKIEDHFLGQYRDFL